MWLLICKARCACLTATVVFGGECGEPGREFARDRRRSCNRSINISSVRADWNAVSIVLSFSGIWVALSQEFCALLLIRAASSP
ncbi:hypothetical protein BDV12DRAFT_178432 [Aspergillus spectabilis]